MLPNLPLNGTAEAHSPEQTARLIFREAIAAVAENAKEKLPQSNGRIEKAVVIVLQDDVLDLGDGHRFAVGSQSDTDLYYIFDNECTCPDADRAPDGACKHVIATWLYRRGTALAAERMKDHLDTPHSRSHSLPEAPASANVYLTIQGRKVQLTLRDHDENTLLTRMESLLTRFPEEMPQPNAQPEGWCLIHQCQMKQYSNGKGSWWAHRIDGRWCRGK